MGWWHGPSIDWPSLRTTPRKTQDGMRNDVGPAPNSPDRPRPLQRRCLHGKRSLREEDRTWSGAFAPTVCHACATRQAPTDATLDPTPAPGRFGPAVVGLVAEVSVAEPAMPGLPADYVRALQPDVLWGANEFTPRLGLLGRTGDAKVSIDLAVAAF